MTINYLLTYLPVLLVTKKYQQWTIKSFKIKTMMSKWIFQFGKLKFNAAVHISLLSSWNQDPAAASCQLVQVAAQTQQISTELVRSRVDHRRTSTTAPLYRVNCYEPHFHLSIVWRQRWRHTEGFCQDRLLVARFRRIGRRSRIDRPKSMTSLYPEIELEVERCSESGGQGLWSRCASLSILYSQ